MKGCVVVVSLTLLALASCGTENATVAERTLYQTNTGYTDLSVRLLTPSQRSNRRLAIAGACTDRDVDKVDLKVVTQRAESGDILDTPQEAEWFVIRYDCGPVRAGNGQVPEVIEDTSRSR